MEEQNFSCPHLLFPDSWWIPGGIAKNPVTPDKLEIFK